jgi:nickel/cobalt exporter
MSAELTVLLLASASIAFFHTILGPDHYLPFIVMARAGGWSSLKTASITALCGLGHVLGSVVLGMLGIAFGFAVAGLESVESSRGNIAAWALMAFGLAYLVWGLRIAWRRKPHTHRHLHHNGTVHEHEHAHAGGHAHVHAEPTAQNMTPWVLFTIFVLGPCEPLIPILMYPAAQNSFAGVALVTVVFGSVTILTMLGVVVAASRGLAHLNLGPLERFSHALAGATILLSGVAVGVIPSRSQTRTGPQMLRAGARFSSSARSSAFLRQRLGCSLVLPETLLGLRHSLLDLALHASEPLQAGLERGHRILVGKRLVVRLEPFHPIVHLRPDRLELRPGGLKIIGRVAFHLARVALGELLMAGHSRIDLLFEVAEFHRRGHDLVVHRLDFCPEFRLQMPLFDGLPASGQHQSGNTESNSKVFHWSPC